MSEIKTEDRPKISAFIITSNEEKKIAECLRSLQWLDETVVVDDSSTDRTREICAEFGVRLATHRFVDFSSQKSYAMSLATNDWVLEMDADERVSDEMRRAIESLEPGDFDRYGAFAFRRLTNFWGKWIRHGSFYPDYKVRLYDRRGGGWSGGKVHERFIPQGRTKKLPVDIVHDQDLDLSDYLRRTLRYANLSASDLHERGRRASWLHICVRPFYTFCYRYAFRLGFLDGIQGFVVAVMGAIGTLCKYSRLHELQKAPPPRH